MNTKTKNVCISLVVALFSVAGAYSASAATFQLSPATFSVNAGQSFTLNVALNSDTGKAYTSKLALDFPADILRVDSFALASGLVAITASGYDSVDNTNGLLVKTGGYPAGVQNTVSFGRVSFTAKKAGSGVISVGSNAMILGNAGQNILTGGSNQTSVSVTNAPLAQNNSTATPAPEATTTPVPPANPEAVNLETTPVQETPTQAPAPNPGQASLLSVANNIFSLGTGQTWLELIVLFILVGAGWYGISYYLKKRNVQSIQPK